MDHGGGRFDRRWLGAAALLLIGAGPPGAPVPTMAEVVGYSARPVERGSFTDPALAAWQRELKAELASKPLGPATAVLARRHGIDAVTMRRLASVVIVARERQYGADERWKKPVQAELRALIPQVRETPFGTAAIAGALDAIEECRADDFAALVAGAADPAAAAYRVASAAPCTANLARAVEAAGGRELPAIVRLLDWGSLPRGTTLALYPWLLEPAQLQRIAPDARDAVAAAWRRAYLKALLDAGLDARALRFHDALAGRERSDLFAAQPHGPALIDGIVVKVGAQDDDAASVMTQTPADTKDLEQLADALEAMADGAAIEAGRAAARRPAAPAAPDPAAAARVAEAARIERETAIDDRAAVALDLAVALAVAGREPEARRLLAGVPQIAVQRRMLRCAYDAAGSRDAGCGQLRDPSGAGLLLDQWLDRRDEDPYWLAEMLFAAGGRDQRLSAYKLAARLYPRAAYPALWADGQRQLASALDLAQSDAMGGDAATDEAVLDRAVPGMAAREAALGAEMASLRAAADIAEDSAVARASVTPQPPSFAEAAIPKAVPRQPPIPSVKGLAALPQGYVPVRMERNGSRAIAVSVSQTLDPTGEVSQGGYWIHLSEDGGSHWDAPLYTGLADRFPYVVPSASPMPLLAGDAVHLAVDIAELDTASISYPPVALRTRRRATGRYLTLPIAQLRADRDGDGLSDLAERHLLLDRAAAGAPTPFVVGSDAARCTGTRSPEADARIALLGRLTGASGAAVVEPLDRTGIGFSGWRGAASADTAPMFLRADPADYHCLRARRPIIVYGAGDLAELQKTTPDFHMLEVPAIQFNRAGDRGYVEWSGGWHGGTYRLRRVDGRWVFDVLSQWIS